MRNCLECRHCWISWGNHHYSEYTPAYPGSAHCNEDQWPPQGGDGVYAKDPTEMPGKRDFFDFAKDCKSYEPEDWALTDDESPTQ